MDTTNDNDSRRSAQNQASVCDDQYLSIDIRPKLLELILSSSNINVEDLKTIYRKLEIGENPPTRKVDLVAHILNAYYDNRSVVLKHTFQTISIHLTRKILKSVPDSAVEEKESEQLYEFLNRLEKQGNSSTKLTVIGLVITIAGVLLTFLVDWNGPANRDVDDRVAQNNQSTAGQVGSRNEETISEEVGKSEFAFDDLDMSLNQIITRLIAHARQFSVFKPTNAFLDGFGNLELITSIQSQVQSARELELDDEQVAKVQIAEMLIEFSHGRLKHVPLLEEIDTSNIEESTKPALLKLIGVMHFFYCNLNAARDCLLEAKTLTNDYEILKALGLIEYRQGNFEKARNNYIDCIKLAEFSASPHDLAEVYSSLAATEYECGRLDSAIETNKDALSLCKAHHGPTSIAFARCKLTQAQIEQNKGKFDDAIQFCKQAISIFQTGSLEYFIGKLLLTNIYLETRGFGAAKTLISDLRSTYPKKEKLDSALLLQLDSAELVLWLYTDEKASNLKQHVKDFENNLKHHNDSLSERLQGIFFGNLAEYYISIRAFTDAESWIDLAIAAEQTYGDKHFQLAKHFATRGNLFFNIASKSEHDKNELGTVYLRNAEKDYTKAIDIEKNRYPSDHPILLKHFSNLASIQCRLGMFTNAESSLIGVVISAKAQNLAFAETNTYLFNLAAVQMKIDTSESINRAFTTISEAEAMIGKIPPNDPDFPTCNAYTNFIAGKILNRLGKNEQSLVKCLIARDAIETVPHANPAFIAELNDLIGKLSNP